MVADQRPGIKDQEKSAAPVCQGVETRPNMPPQAAEADGKDSFCGVSIRIFALSLGLLCSLFSTGLVYGWPALVVVLDREGTYTSLCDGGARECDARELKLSNIFIVGSSGVFVSIFLFGLFMDAFGPRTTAVVGLCISGSGSVLMALSDPERGRDYFLPGFGLLGLASACVHLALFSFANLFPNRKSTIVSIIVGTFTASGFIFVLFNLFNNTASVSRSALFTIHASIVGTLLLVALWVFPSTPFLPGTSLLLKDWRISPVVSAEDSTKPSSRVVQTGEYPAVLHALAFKEQLISVDCVAVCLWWAVHVLRIQWIIGSAADQLGELGDDDDTYTSLVSIIIPGVGILASTVPGLFIDKHGITLGVVLSEVLSVLYGTLICIPSLPLQLLTYVLVACARAFIFSTAFAYFALTFGQQNFGKLVGIGALCAAITSQLQFGLAPLGTSVGFLLPNLLMLACSPVQVFFASFVRKRPDTFKLAPDGPQSVAHASP